MSVGNLIICQNCSITDGVALQRVIEKQLFSPSGKRAIVLLTIKRIVQSVLVFDAVLSQYYLIKVENSSQEFELKKDLLYWLDETTVVVLYSDDEKREFVQIPLVLNYIEKTYTPMKASTYAYSPDDKIANLHYRCTKTTEVILIQRKKYILWRVGRYTGGDARVFYAIPYLPNTSEAPKKFFIPIYAYYRLNSRIVNKLEILPEKGVKSCNRFYAENGMIICPMKIVDSGEFVIPGVFIMIDFEKAADVYEMPPIYVLERTRNAVYELMQRKGITLDLAEVGNLDLSKVSEEGFVKEWRTFYIQGHIVYLFNDENGGDIEVKYGNLNLDDIKTLKTFKNPSKGPLYSCQTPFGINVYWSKRTTDSGRIREILYESIAIPRNGNSLSLAHLTTQAILRNKKYLNDSRTWRLLAM